jgi:hypothetical protein
MNLSSLPVVAGMKTLGHQHLFKSDRLRFLRSTADAGPLARVRFLRRWVVMVSSPEVVHEVLVEHASSFEKSPALRMVLHDIAGQGLFTSEGDLWKRQRRLMSPLFHPSQLGRYATSMNAVARRAALRARDPLGSVGSRARATTGASDGSPRRSRTRPLQYPLCATARSYGSSSTRDWVTRHVAVFGFTSTTRSSAIGSSG